MKIAINYRYGTDPTGQRNRLYIPGEFKEIFDELGIALIPITQKRYCFVYSMQLSVDPASHEIGSRKIIIIRVMIAPTTNANIGAVTYTSLARLRLPDPRDVEITAQEPITNKLENAVSKIIMVADNVNAATIDELLSLPTKNVSARL